MECISYKKGYKYQLYEDYSTEISIKPGNDIDSDYIALSGEGLILIKKGYAWDGPSGPTIDTPNFMRGSLVHDALYQLMREQKLVKEACRKQADQILQKICEEDGMSSARSLWVYLGVRVGGDSAASKENINLPIKAPEARGE